MQNSHDEQFENYLKRFQPVTPDPLPATEARQRFSSLFASAAWIAASAAILIAALVVFHTRKGQGAVRLSQEPLTIATANSWLATAPSFQTAFDELAFREKANSFPPGKQSAIAVLSEERMK